MWRKAYESPHPSQLQTSLHRLGSRIDSDQLFVFLSGFVSDHTISVAKFNADKPRTPIDIKIADSFLNSCFRLVRI